MNMNDKSYDNDDDEDDKNDDDGHRSANLAHWLTECFQNNDKRVTKHLIFDFVLVKTFLPPGFLM